MSKRNPTHEIEIKLRVADPRRLRLQLKRLRAERIVPRTFESNTLYDTKSRDLFRHGQLIRVRIERMGTSGTRSSPGGTGGALLTYKGPFRSGSASKLERRNASIRRRYKTLHEVEVVVDPAGRISRILKALGLAPVFRYEKYRTTYKIPGVTGLKVEFDETPIGLFLELEGSPRGIDRAAKLLGYTQVDYVTESYGALYLAECRRRGTKTSDMLFRVTKKLG